MLEAVLAGLVAAQAVGLGVCLWQQYRLGRRLEDLTTEVAHDQEFLGSLLERADVKALGDELTIVEEWRAEMLAAPEGSPKREAYANRLRELGAL